MQFIGDRRIAAFTIRRRITAACVLSVVLLAAASTVLAQPANDDFANRIALTGSSLSVTGSNIGATKEPGEPNHAGWTGGHSVWWSWVAPSATSARIDTIGSGFSTALAIYTGTVVSNLTLAASAGQTAYTNSHWYSQTGFAPTAGTEYQIAVDIEFGDPSDVVLNVTTGVPVITSQPQTQAAPLGSNVTFSVAALGDPPLSYWWRKSNVGRFMPITNAVSVTSAELTLTNVKAADAFSYFVVVSNSLGTATSLDAILSIPVEEPYFFTTIAGKSGSTGSADGPGDGARFSNPVSVALDAEGNLYVAEIENSTIRKLAPTGTNWQVSTVAGLAGVSGFVDGTNSDARFYLPNGVAVDGAGVLYVADRGNSALRRIAPDGTNWIVSTIVTGLTTPGYCAVDSAGNVYVTEVVAGSIKKCAWSGANWVVSLVASGLSLPDRIAVDAATNLYVSANGKSIICKITPSGSTWVVSTLAGTGSAGPPVDGTNSSAQFNRPEGVAVDSAGSVYVGDYYNKTIRKITPAGVTTTLAGLGGARGSLDGAGSAARFSGPNGVAVDSHGTVYVADEYNSAIRMGRPVIQMRCPPGVLSGQIQTQGFSFTAAVASGLNYRIQTSANLSNWVDLTNLTPGGLSLSFTDEGATNLPLRFYRVLGP